VTMAQGAAFIRAGKPMKAQQLLLRELNTEFGGQARAFGTTLPGAFSKLRNATDEVTGAFAAGLAPVVQRVATLLSTKMADPAFVARVRVLGRLVGEKLVQAFTAVSTWFQAHWPQIQGGFRTFVTVLQTAARHAGTLKAVLVTITKPLQIQFQILLAIWDKVLAAVSVGAGLMSHLPFVGDKFSGVQAAAETARESLKNPLGTPGKGKKKPLGTVATYGGAHASGGHVMPGVRYLVGEQGPEMFVSRTSGNIIPNGGGGDTIVPVYLDGRQIALVVSPHQERMRKNRSSQTRGRRGGNAWSI